MRLTLRIGNDISTRSPRSSAGAAASISCQSRASASGESCARMRRTGVPSGTSGTREEPREVDPALLPVRDRVVGLEQVDAADEVLVAAHAEPRHDLARLLGDVEEEVDDVLGLAR